MALAVDRAPLITRPLLRYSRQIEIAGGALIVFLGLALIFDWLGWFARAPVASSGSERLTRVTDAAHVALGDDGSSGRSRCVISSWSASSSWSRPAAC